MHKYDLEIFWPEIRNRISDCFIKDTWTVKDACRLLAGLLPEPFDALGWFTLEGIPLDESEKSANILAMVHRLENIWNSNPDNPKIATPEMFINWAIAKGFSPPWLDAVKEHGFYTPTQEKLTPLSLNGSCIEEQGNKSEPALSNWVIAARKIAADHYRELVGLGKDINLEKMSLYVATEMSNQNINGENFRLKAGTIKRSALQGQWWKTLKNPPQID